MGEREASGSSADTKCKIAVYFNVSFIDRIDSILPQLLLENLESSPVPFHLRYLKLWPYGPMAYGKILCALTEGEEEGGRLRETEGEGEAGATPHFLLIEIKTCYRENPIKYIRILEWSRTSSEVGQGFGTQREFRQGKDHRAAPFDNEMNAQQTGRPDAEALAAGSLDSPDAGDGGAAVRRVGTIRAHLIGETSGRPHEMRAVAGPAPPAPAAGIALGADVRNALASGGAVVALETTIVCHGLPYPKNLEVAERCEAAVRVAGAVPATIALVHGVPTAGLTREQLELLAREGTSVAKCSRRDIPALVARRSHGACTVSGTMAVAAYGSRVMGRGSGQVRPGTAAPSSSSMIFTSEFLLN